MQTFSRFDSMSRLPERFQTQIPSFSAFANLANRFNVPRIPDSAMTAVISMGQHFERMSVASKAISINPALYNSIRGMSTLNGIRENFYSHRVSAVQISTLQTAMAGISSSLARYYAKIEDWESLDEFAEVTADVAEMSERLTGGGSGITMEDFEFFKTHILKICADLYKSVSGANKEKREKIIFVVTLLSLVVSVAQCVLPYVIPPDSNAVTKNDIVPIHQVLTSVHQELVPIHQELAAIHKLLEGKNEVRMIVNDCSVYLKPKTGSLIIDSIKDYLNVVVLDSQNKWCYISYTSREDGLPGNGWVQKKNTEYNKAQVSKRQNNGIRRVIKAAKR